MPRLRPCFRPLGLLLFAAAALAVWLHSGAPLDASAGSDRPGRPIVVDYAGRRAADASEGPGRTRNPRADEELRALRAAARKQAGRRTRKRPPAEDEGAGLTAGDEHRDEAPEPDDSGAERTQDDPLTTENEHASADNGSEPAQPAHRPRPRRKKNPLSPPPSSPSPPPPAPPPPPSAPTSRPCRFPYLAVALKTGRSVARARLPPVLATWARDLCHLALLTDSNGQLDASVVQKGYKGEFNEAGTGEARLGTGARDFLVELGGREFRAYDVVGGLYDEYEGGDPDADPVRVRAMEVRWRDRWMPGEWERAEGEGDKREGEFLEKRRAERRKEREEKERKAREEERGKGDGEGEGVKVQRDAGEQPLPGTGPDTGGSSSAVDDPPRDKEPEVEIPKGDSTPIGEDEPRLEGQGETVRSADPDEELDDRTADESEGGEAEEEAEAEQPRRGMRRIGRRNRHRKDHMPRRRRLLRREGAVERPRRVRRLRTRPRRQLLLERVLPPRKLLPDRELKPRRRSPSESSLHRRHRPRRQRRRRLTKRGTGGTYKGWASDAEKNLPAFVELWNRFPDAKWYLMVDDDAYPFLASLWRHLESHYDASEVHYIGKAFQFTGCHWEPRADDRVKELYFASGGAGIVLSRGAMLAALPLARLGVQLTKGCWAGDARVAIWLYEARARLEWPWQVGGRMHVGPQGPWHSFGRACDPVLTYHLVPPDKYPRIGAVERSPASGGGHVTNADMWHVFWDRAGEELLGLEGRVDRDTGRGGMDFLELSPAPEGGTVDDFGEAAEEDLADLLEGTYNKPHLTDKVRRGLNATGLDPRTPMYRKAALALRCMEACHALDRVTDIPAAVAVPPRPVDAFHGRVAKPANLLDNRSSRFGPCTQWTLAPNGACWLKSGFSQPGAAGGHWSGIVDGALERYAAVGKDRAAGALCGWDAGVRDG